MKKCTKCGEEKPLTEFHKKRDSKDGCRSYCKICDLEQNKLYRQENKEKINEQNKLYYQENKEKISEQKKLYRQENKEKIKLYRQENKEKINEQNKLYRQENKEKVSRWRKRSYEENKINRVMSAAICSALKKRNLSKNNSSWIKLVDYTLEELKQHLEKQFEPWMNWDNHGLYEKDKQKWHIDHIKPQSLFEIKTAGDEEFKKCWALENLRPLEAIENMSKGAKLLEDLVSI